MACIRREKRWKKYGYYLVESYRDNGKVKTERTYLGMKPPWPKSQGWTGLDNKTVAELKAKAAKRREAKAKLQAILSDTRNLDGQNIITGSLTNLMPETVLPDNSVALFFTDPPYSQETLELFSQLGELAARKLKPGGLCLTYAPQPHLAKIIEMMGSHLKYWWIFSVSQTGLEPRIWKNKLWVGWKPILAFAKPSNNGRLTDTWFRDNFRGLGEDKRYHKWGQDIHEATYWLEALTPLGEMVVDPFCGGGTIPLACKITGRRWLATELDPVTAAIARKRLEECNGRT